MRGPAIKNSTTTRKSPKGKALKQTLSDARPEARARARQSKPIQAGRRVQGSESSDGASTENDTTYNESDDAGQSSSDGAEGEDDEARAGPGGQSTEWYESDYRSQGTHVEHVTPVSLAKASALIDGYRKDPYKT